MKRLCLFLPIILSSCTVSVSLVHTEGTASDVVDSTPTTSTEAQAEATVPASII